MGGIPKDDIEKQIDEVKAQVPQEQPKPVDTPVIGENHEDQMDPKQIEFYEALGELGKKLMNDGMTTIRTRKMRLRGKTPRLKNPVILPRSQAWSGHKSLK